MQNISVISLKNILSLSVGCLFILLLVSFAVQKLLSLIMPYFFIFAFISFGFGEDLPPKRGGSAFGLVGILPAGASGIGPVPHGVDVRLLSLPGRAAAGDPSPPSASIPMSVPCGFILGWAI